MSQSGRLTQSHVVELSGGVVARHIAVDEDGMYCPKCGYRGEFRHRGALEWNPSKWECPGCGKSFDPPGRFAMRRAQKARQDQPSEPGSQSTGSVAGEIERLGALRDKGLLTQGEFEQQKQKLLRR